MRVVMGMAAALGLLASAMPATAQENDKSLEEAYAILSIGEHDFESMAEMERPHAHRAPAVQRQPYVPPRETLDAIMATVHAIDIPPDFAAAQPAPEAIAAASRHWPAATPTRDRLRGSDIFVIMLAVITIVMMRDLRKRR